MRLARLLPAFLFAAIATSSAFGQAVPDQPYLSLSQASVWLLIDANVRGRLDLKADQTKAVQDAIAHHNRAQAALYKDKRATAGALRQLDLELASNASKPLTADQRERLLFLAAKARGVRSLLDPAVAAKLKLTSTQTAELKTTLSEAAGKGDALNEEMANKIAALPSTSTPEGRKALQQQAKAIVKEYQPRIDAAEAERQAAEKKALEVLTSAQREQWDAMTAATGP